MTSEQVLEEFYKWFQEQCRTHPSADDDLKAATCAVLRNAVIQFNAETKSRAMDEQANLEEKN